MTRPDNKRFIPFLGIFLICTILAVKTWITFHSQNKTEPEITISPSIKNFSTPTTSMQKNQPGWDTFSSKKFNYSFQYPPDWKSSFFNENTAVMGSNTVQNYDGVEIEKYMDHGMINIKKYGRSIGKVEVTVADNSMFDDSGTKETNEYFTVGSQQVRAYEIPGNDHYTRILKIQLEDNKRLNILISVYNVSESTTTNELAEITNKILATFMY